MQSCTSPSFLVRRIIFEAHSRPITQDVFTWNKLFHLKDKFHDWLRLDLQLIQFVLPFQPKTIPGAVSEFIYRANQCLWSRTMIVSTRQLFVNGCSFHLVSAAFRPQVQPRDNPTVVLGGPAKRHHIAWHASKLNQSSPWLVLVLGSVTNFLRKFNSATGCNDDN